MPLYMDLHKGSEFTLEDVKRNHIADLNIQHKYGVKYIQYWVNDEAGMVFCLMDGPDKESCAAVHREAHGDIACNIVEVEKGKYELFMGEGRKNKDDQVEELNGELDAGYRVFLAVSFVGPQELVSKLEGLVGDTLKIFGGREIIQPDDRILAVFNSCKEAVKCSQVIQSEVGLFKQKYGNEKGNQVEVRIGVAAGEPVTEEEGFFGETLDLTNRLNEMAGKDEVVVSCLVKDLCLGRRIKINPKAELFKVLTPADEQLLIQVMEVAESRLNDSGFSVQDFGSNIGMSRPQLYRKITSLTGLSPNDLIKELRLKKAAALVKKGKSNISEIAYEVGFSNPSYFAKCFQKRFGIRPSEYSV